MIVTPHTQPSEAWQYTGDAPWPAWVKRCCEIRDGLMIHMRQSGDQELRDGEWLVKDLDGEVLFYTPDEFEREFIINK